MALELPRSTPNEALSDKVLEFMPLSPFPRFLFPQPLLLMYHVDLKNHPVISVKLLFKD